MSLTLRSALRPTRLTALAAFAASFALVAACNSDDPASSSADGSGGAAGTGVGGESDGAGGTDGAGVGGSGGTSASDGGAGGANVGGSDMGGASTGGASTTGGTSNTGGNGTGGTITEPAPNCVEPEESLSYWWSCRVDLMNPMLSMSDIYAAMREEIHNAHGSNIGSLSWSIASSTLVGEAFVFSQPPSAQQPNYIHAYGDFPLSTVEFWFSTTKTDARLVTTMSERYVTRLTSGKLSVVIDDMPPSWDLDVGAGPFTLDASQTLSDGKPHHVATTLDLEAGKFRLYVDGSLADSLDLSEDIIFATNLDIGGELVMGGPNDPFAINPAASTYFTGSIDEVSLYGEALSGEDIAAIYSAKLTGKCLHLEP